MFYKVFDAHALTFVMTLAIPNPLPPTMLFVVLAGKRLKPIWEELQKTHCFTLLSSIIVKIVSY